VSKVKNGHFFNFFDSFAHLSLRKIGKNQNFKISRIFFKEVTNDALYQIWGQFDKKFWFRGAFTKI